MLEHLKRYQDTELDESHGKNQNTTKIIIYKKSCRKNEEIDKRKIGS